MFQLTVLSYRSTLQAYRANVYDVFVLIVVFQE